MYIIKLKGIFCRVLKRVKGHIILKENPNIMMVIYANEEREFINISKYKRIKFSDGWYKLETENINRDSNGKAVL